MGQITVKEYLSNIQTGLDAELVKNVKALPDGFNRQRFILNCIAMLKGDLKKWNNVEPASIITTLAKGAYLGLDFFNGECYAIPYGNDVNFQTDYKGEIKLAKKYSEVQIKDIYAKLVREGDFFEEEIVDGRQSVSFKPVPFSDGEIKGAFAVVLFGDGSMSYETMSKKEIESVREGFSKAKNSPAWVKTPGEMYKKTVLRRLLKYVTLDFDNEKQDAAFADGGDFDPNKVVDVEAKEIHDPFSQKIENVQEAPAPIEVGGLELEEV